MYDATATHSMKLDITLPIAPHANHRMKKAATEEKAPSLVPAEAVAWVQALRKGGKEIQSIDLSGPGDVLASVATTLNCLELLQPEIRTAELSLTTIGLGVSDLALELARLGVVKVTLLVNTYNVETAKKLYAWIRPAKKNIPLAKASEMLIAAQAEAVQALTAAGIRVVIRTARIAGVNDSELTEIAGKMGSLGAAAMEIEGEEELERDEVALSNSFHFPVTLYRKPVELRPPGTPGSCEAVSMPKPTAKRPNIAVVSTNGMDVDMHLGQASQVLIYGPRDDGLTCLLMARKTPGTGGGSDRWQLLARECLHDCFVLLATHAGDAPRKELAELGIKVFLSEDNIEGLVDVLYGGGKKKLCKK